MWYFSRELRCAAVEMVPERAVCFFLESADTAGIVSD
jgi:hypothetical protein